MVVFPVAVTNSSLSFIFRCWCVIHVLISNVRSLQVRDFQSLILGKKIPDYVHPWGEFSIQNVVLSVNRRKQPKIFPCETFLCFGRNVHQSALIPRNLTCPEKFLIGHLFYPIEN